MMRLARQYTSHAVDMSGSSFDQVIRVLATGHPVWTITTTSFAPVHDWQRWTTPQGHIKVTYSMNSVVITGYDRTQKLIYVNDPYGIRTKPSVGTSSRPHTTRWVSRLFILNNVIARMTIIHFNNFSTRSWSPGRVFVLGWVLAY